MTGILTALLSAMLTACVTQGAILLRERHEKQLSRSGSRREKQECLYAGVLTLLRDRLFGACRECIRAGTVDTEELENISALYAAYHALGGNGTGTTLYDRVRLLPVKEETL